MAHVAPVAPTNRFTPYSVILNARVCSKRAMLYEQIRQSDQRDQPSGGSGAPAACAWLSDEPGRLARRLGAGDWQTRAPLMVAPASSPVAFCSRFRAGDAHGAMRAPVRRNFCASVSARGEVRSPLYSGKNYV